MDPSQRGGGEVAGHAAGWLQTAMLRPSSIGPIIAITPVVLGCLGDWADFGIRQRSPAGTAPRP
jgi:hypothetical protein